MWLANELSKVNWRQVAAAVLPLGVTLAMLLDMTPHQLAETLFEGPSAPAADDTAIMRRINERRAEKGQRPVWSRPLRDEATPKKAGKNG